jgi:hypothetical protein
LRSSSASGAGTGCVGDTQLGVAAKSVWQLGLCTPSTAATPMKRGRVGSISYVQLQLYPYGAVAAPKWGGIYLVLSLTYCMGQAIPIMPKFWSAPPLFLEDEDIFQKSASVVLSRIEFWI